MQSVFYDIKADILKPARTLNSLLSVKIKQLQNTVMWFHIITLDLLRFDHRFVLRGTWCASITPTKASLVLHSSFEEREQNSLLDTYRAHPQRLKVHTNAFYGSSYCRLFETCALKQLYIVYRVYIWFEGPGPKPRGTCRRNSAHCCMNTMSWRRLTRK